MLNTIFLLLHIAAGSSSLISGALAIIFRKGSKKHSLSGEVYFWSMLLVGISAVWLSIAESIWFLFSVGLFSTYLTVGGKLIFNKTSKLPSYWRLFSISGFLVAASMLIVTIMLFLKQNNAYIILGVFTALQLFTATKDLRYLKRFSPKTHYFQHINKMGGAYIATCTAFLVVNIKFLPDLLVWLAPAAVGTALITITTIQWRKKLNIKS